jgi:hypothetical protein
MPISVDMSELPLEILFKMHKVLTEENAFSLVQAKIRQQNMAKFYHDHPARNVEGMGEKTMAVDPYWIAYWNMKMGRQIWQDPDFKKWLLKNDEMFRVKSTSSKIQVGYAPTRSTFRKVYADS